MFEPIDMAVYCNPGQILKERKTVRYFGSSLVFLNQQI